MDKGRTTLMEYLFLVISMISSVSRSLFSKRLCTLTSDLAGFGAVNTLISGTALASAFVYGLSRMDISISTLTLALGVLYAFFTVMAQFSYMRALSGGRVSAVSFFYSCGFLIPTAAGILIWREGITIVGAVGIALLIPAFGLCGASDKAARKENAGDERLDEKGHLSRFHAEKSWIPWAVAAMISSGAVGLIQKIHRSSSAADEVSGFIIVSMGVSVILSVIPLLFSAGSQRSLPVISKKEIIAALICGLCVGVSNIINLVLAGIIPAVIFFPVFNGGVVILSSAAARIFYGERMTGRGIAGMICGLCGLALAALR